MMRYKNVFKLTTVFLLFSFFVNTPAFAAQPVSTRSILIYGKVMDRQTQAPLASASLSAIVIPGAAGHNIILTNQQGEYSLSIQVKSPWQWLKSFYCLVTCAKTGYFSQTKFLYIGQSTKVVLNFSLKPKKTPADTIPPSGTIEINNNTLYSNSLSVILNLSAQDNSGGSGLSQMQFSNDAVTWSTPEAYSISKAWTLSAGDNTKTVYVKYKDVAGNWSAAFSDTIILDTTAPQLNIISPLNNEVVRP